MSNSKYFSFIRLKAKAPAEALKTEKSSAPFTPVEKVIETANSNSRNPLNFANSSVLNPIIKKNANLVFGEILKSVDDLAQYSKKGREIPKINEDCY